MTYKVKATQTIYKYFEITADSRDEALGKALDMAGDGEIRFDDEPYLEMEVDVKIL